MASDLTFNYTTYWGTVNLVPLIALSVSFVGTLITFYTITMLCWPFRRMLEKCAHKSVVRKILAQVETDGGKLPCWTCILGGLKLVYGNEVDELEAKGKPTIYSICGRHVRPWLLAVLFLIVMFVCSCTMVAFWNTFLVEESRYCKSDMDCFVINETTRAPLTEHPLTNCSDYAAQNFTIHCYKFVFNYASALGDAGGVLVLASVIMNIQAGLWVGASSQQGRVGWWCAVSAVFTLNVVCGLVLLAAPIVVSTVPVLRDRISNTDRSRIQFYTYWATFVCAFIFSGPILMIFSRRLRNETTIDGEAQYVSTNSHFNSVPLTYSVGGDSLNKSGSSEWRPLNPQLTKSNYMSVN